MFESGWPLPSHPRQELAPAHATEVTAGAGRGRWAQRLAAAARAAAVGVALVATLGTSAVQARTEPDGLPTVALSTLPPEAQHTKRLILAGGPFPYQKDGTVFFNRERLLPAHPRGFYREYTVKTPGARNRGARRIVCGGAVPTTPQACYYTADHYASFRRIEAGR